MKKYILFLRNGNPFLLKKTKTYKIEKDEL